MKIIKCFLFLIAVCFFQNKADGQDSLSVEVLKPLMYSFTLENGKLEGNGAAFLRKELEQTHVTLLGEYYESKQISEFTAALIPQLNAFNYKTIVLNTGPVSGKILDGFSKKSGNISSHLKKFNQQYAVEKKGKLQVPILDMKHVEEAQYLQTASNHQWSIIGIGEESKIGFKVLADQMFANLSKTSQSVHQKLYQTTIDSLDHFYNIHFSDLLQFSTALKNSKTIKSFLEKISTEPRNLEIINAWKYSFQMCDMLANKVFYEKNSIRVKTEKHQFKKAMETHQLDLSQDKILVKMGLAHLSRGFQPSGHFGLGNMLHEVANYHGNQALSIGFFRRFYMENGVLKDELDRDYYLTKRFKKLIQAGKKDEWTIIDLRPLIKGVYYWDIKYLVNPWVEDLMKRYELIILPPTDFAPTVNY